MSKIRAAVLVTLSLTSIGCLDRPLPTEPSSDPTPSFTVVDASGPQGVAGFHFHAPIGDEPVPTEGLDGSLVDLLSVEICEWTGSECILPLVRKITSEENPPERLFVSDDAIYTTVWNTWRDDPDPDRTYRIRVMASGGQLGYVDVDVIEPRRPSRTGQGDEDRLHIVAGQALPIGFVIEEGAGARAGSEGGTVELAEGQVVLTVPAGALENDVLLTATQTDDTPTGGPPIVPGTAWDFGPDGTEFVHPVFMTIAFDPTTVPAGVDPSELRIHKVVGGEFVQQNAGLVDLDNNTVSAEVEGFSVFVVIPRDSENPEDIVPPEIRSMSVFDPATGTWGNATTLELSSSDATLNFRIEIVDNIVGVSFIDVRWVSPTGRQRRFPCFTGAAPSSGSDTNGQWECQTDFPQYAEAGVWEPQLAVVSDRINNAAFYGLQPTGFCDSSGSCVTDIPAITVNSVPQDIDPPALQSLQVSADIQPRVFGSTVSVDASSGFQTVIFGMQATDDLSGVGGGFFFDRFEIWLRGPGNQNHFLLPLCQRTEGTTLDGFWECSFSIPQQAETGMWEMTYLRVPDRAGNGGSSGSSDFQLDGSGQLCNPGGNCVTPPTVQVSSAGDGEPPSLASVDIAVDQSDVVTTTVVADAISGVSLVRVRYSSTETTQFQECFASLGPGTPNEGSWSCTITFSEFAALGQWDLSVEVWDVAGNSRFYFRRASDGYLCYFDPDTGTNVCQDFGDTDLILE